LVDVHSHLVPGVDDGARDLAATLASVERFTRLGVRKILTTPHIKASLTHEPADLEARLAEVTSAWESAADAVGKAFPEVRFLRGHEVMLDVPDGRFADPRLRMAGTSFILVEWPRLGLPPSTPAVIERLVREGHRPIIAHPERYNGMGQALPLAGRWRELGASLQVNAGSLVGRYGQEARKTAFRLLRRGWVDYLASDFHGHASHRLYHEEACEALEALGAEEQLRTLTLANPGRVLQDEPPLPVAPLPAERGFWNRVREILKPERD